MAVMTEIKQYGRHAPHPLSHSLIELQLQSFERLKNEYIIELFDEISPIVSYNEDIFLYLPSFSQQSKQYQLTYWFETPRYTPDECLDRGLTFAAPLYVKVALHNRKTDEHVVEVVYFGDFPMMTENGTFIINGVERVIISQIIRSPGVYVATDEKLNITRAKVIPDRGSWLEFEIRRNNAMMLRFNKRRTLPVSIFLRALAGVDDGIGGVLESADDQHIAELLGAHFEPTLKLEPEWRNKGKAQFIKEVLIECFKRLRPGDPPTYENARQLFSQTLFDPRYYDLERFGRYKLNQRLGLDGIVPPTCRTLTKQDIARTIACLIEVYEGRAEEDNMDDLGNRRVRTNGELIKNKLRIGLKRMEKSIKDRMSIAEAATSVSKIVNIRPFTSAIRDFFNSSELSQFMEQTNPLTELTMKRTLSALGPGGLKREQAGFDVRDVDQSHYGRVCPIETPEGQNIGLIVRLAYYARLNAYGFIETPYRKVKHNVLNDQLAGHTLSEDLFDKSGELLASAGTFVDENLAKQIAAKVKAAEIAVMPYASDEVEYLTADRESHYIIAQGNTKLNKKGEFQEKRVAARQRKQFVFVDPDKVDYIDISPNQIIGVSASLIPFIEHDEAARALMGANMQRQAVPLIKADVPLVGTGVESSISHNDRYLLRAKDDGEVISVTSSQIVLKSGRQKETYNLSKYKRTNQDTCINQQPIVCKGARVQRGQVLADSFATKDGQIAIGQNVLVAFISWEGWNYEDAIIISERLVRDDLYTSIHIKEYEASIRETKLGPEEMTRDIPNVSEDALANLGLDGVVRVGSTVSPHDILVGKVSPRGERDLTAEEKLLRAIFGDKSREVRDSSLRVPHGEHGTVIQTRVTDRQENPDLPVGVLKTAKVIVAQKRKIAVGDKMAGRHGNKGVVAKIAPIEDMPFLEDGTPVDIILNPLGVPSRMNIGQVLEAHVGWAAAKLGFRAVSPPFDGATRLQIEADLCRAWLVDRAYREVIARAWETLKAQQVDTTQLRDEHDALLAYLGVWMADEAYDFDRALSDQHYVRRLIVRKWLAERGHDPRVMEYIETDDEKDRGAIQTCLQIWLEDRGHRVEAKSFEDILSQATQVSLQCGEPLPTLGKVRLFDGITGEPFQRPVTVGYVYMMKLAHLVEDKVHARSTGPYSLVTQQPLGGKSHFGGQRLGEMEVWALEAYGASYTLQEMLTLKSDDVEGRTDSYDAIIKGEPIKPPHLPASFKVLVKELQALGLSVEGVTEDGKVMNFGKEQERTLPPVDGLGLFEFLEREASSTRRDD